MGLRQLQEKHGSLVPMVAGLVLLVAVVAIALEVRHYMGWGRSKGVFINKVYFLDLEKNQLVAQKDTTIPPVPAPGGDGKDLLVRAYVYSCGDCKDEKTRQIAYLEKFTPQAMAEMDKAGIKELPPYWNENLPPEALKGWIVGTSDDKHWYPRNSYQGRELAESFASACGNSPAVTNECLPQP